MGIRLLALSLFMLISSHEALSGEDCTTRVSSALKDAIRENDLRVRNGGKSPETGIGFKQHRRLYAGRESYLALLGKHFFHHLYELGPNDRWIDVGAGPEFIAMRDYQYDDNLGQKGKAKLVPINVTDSITHGPEIAAAVAKFKTDSGAETHADGRTIEEYKKGEIKPGRLVTDSVAAVTYSPQLPKVIEAAGTMVIEGGHFDSVLLESWGGESCVSIVDQHGRNVALVDYLNAIRGMKLEQYYSERVAGSVYALQFSLQRTTGDVVAPPLELVSFKNSSGLPNQRAVPQIVYKWTR
jgi:hypothetical protein